MANQDGEKYHVEKLDRKINEYTNKRKKKTKTKNWKTTMTKSRIELVWLLESMEPVSLTGVIKQNQYNPGFISNYN